MGKAWICLAATAWFVVPASLRAAAVTFSAATTISGDSNISTTGTLDRAFTFDGTAVTVNGVAFAAFPGGSSPQTVGSTTLTTSGGGTIGMAAGAYTGGTNAPFANLSANYKTLLSNGVYNDGQQFALTLGGLTIGQPYQFEVLVNDSRGGGTATRSESVTSGGGNTVILAYDAAQTVGGVGQFTLGTFTADATSQVINFNSANAQLNAFQLRAVPAPEPAALGLIGAGALGLLRNRRRKA